MAAAGRVVWRGLRRGREAWPRGHGFCCDRPAAGNGLPELGEGRNAALSWPELLLCVLRVWGKCSVSLGEEERGCAAIIV